MKRRQFHRVGPLATRLVRHQSFIIRRCWSASAGRLVLSSCPPGLAPGACTARYKSRTYQLYVTRSDAMGLFLPRPIMECKRLAAQRRGWPGQPAHQRNRI